MTLIKTIKKIIFWIFLLGLFIAPFSYGLFSEDYFSSKPYKSPPTPTPTPDPKILEDISEKFCETRQGESAYGVFFCLGCVNLDDADEYLSSGETVTIRSARVPAKKGSCDKVAKSCVDNWDTETCKKIAGKNIWLGMTKSQLIVSMGPPKDKNNSVGSWGYHSQWVYSDYGPYIYLEGEDKDNLKVTSWQD